MYDNAEEAHHRLLNTVILYEAKPVYVHMVTDYHPLKKGAGIYLECYTLPDMVGKNYYELSDPKFEYHSMRLGYVNGRNHAVYLSRMPARKIKQGLYNDNILITKLPSAVDEAGGRNAAPRMTFQQIMKTQGFVDMCAGEYPTFDKVLKSMKADGEVVSQAFSRQLALQKDGLGVLNLYYRGERVALSDNGDVFKTSADYSFLKEVMAENGIKFVEKDNAA